MGHHNAFCVFPLKIAESLGLHDCLLSHHCVKVTVKATFSGVAPGSGSSEVKGGELLVGRP